MGNWQGSLGGGWIANQAPGLGGVTITAGPVFPPMSPPPFRQPPPVLPPLTGPSRMGPIPMPPASSPLRPIPLAPPIYIPSHHHSHTAMPGHGMPGSPFHPAHAPFSPIHRAHTMPHTPVFYPPPPFRPAWPQHPQIHVPPPTRQRAPDTPREKMPTLGRSPLPHRHPHERHLLRPSRATARAVDPAKQKAIVGYPRMFISQFVLGETREQQQHACFKAAALMATETAPGVPAVHLADRDHRILIAEGGADMWGRTVTNPKQAEKALEYIDAALDHGFTVMVGVAWGFKVDSRSDPTNHFVTIYGRNYDSEGTLIYHFKDPGTSYEKYSEGVFYVDSSTGKIFRLGSDPSQNVAPFSDYEVTEVRTFKEFPPARR